MNHNGIIFRNIYLVGSIIKEIKPRMFRMVTTEPKHEPFNKKDELNISLKYTGENIYSSWLKRKE